MPYSTPYSNYGFGPEQRFGFPLGAARSTTPTPTPEPTMPMLPSLPGLPGAGGDGGSNDVLFGGSAQDLLSGAGPLAAGAVSRRGIGSADIGAGIGSLALGALTRGNPIGAGLGSFLGGMLGGGTPGRSGGIALGGMGGMALGGPLGGILGSMLAGALMDSLNPSREQRVAMDVAMSLEPFQEAYQPGVTPYSGGPGNRGFNSLADLAAALANTFQGPPSYTTPSQQVAGDYGDAMNADQGPASQGYGFSDM